MTRNREQGSQAVRACSHRANARVSTNQDYNKAQSTDAESKQWMARKHLCLCVSASISVCVLAPAFDLVLAQLTADQKPAHSHEQA